MEFAEACCSQSIGRLSVAVAIVLVVAVVPSFPHTRESLWLLAFGFWLLALRFWFLALGFPFSRLRGKVPVGRMGEALALALALALVWACF